MPLLVPHYCRALYGCSPPLTLCPGRPDVAATKCFDEVFSEREYRALVQELQAQVRRRVR